MTVHSISEANKKSDTRAPDVAKAGTEDDIDFVELTQTLEEKLERAETLQTEADSLTDSIADLELQMIEAEMRQNNTVLGLSPDEAGVIGDLLERQALLQAQLGATETQSEERRATQPKNRPRQKRNPAYRRSLHPVEQSEISHPQSKPSL